MACGIFVAVYGIFSYGMQTRNCSTQDIVQGSNPGPLHWGHRVVPTGPPRKSPSLNFKINSPFSSQQLISHPYPLPTFFVHTPTSTPQCTDIGFVPALQKDESDFEGERDLTA